MTDIIDRIAIYKKLISIKPFFLDVAKIKKKKAFETLKEVELKHTGGVWIEIK